MRIITRTVWGASLQTALLLGLPYEPQASSTLNEKFNLYPDEPLNGAIPHVQYLCIGNGGHQFLQGADGVPYTHPIHHRASDAALFNHLPFVMRPVDEDLTIDQREHYALRRVITLNGEEYIAYYLKRLDFTSVTRTLEHTEIIDGVLKKTPFIANTDALNPTHPAIPNTGVITTDGNYLSNSAILTIDFNAEAVSELVNVAQLLYGNEQYAALSEIGLCSGIDRIVTTDGFSGSFNYREAIGVQIATHITGYYPVGYTNRGFELQIEAGAAEPLLGEGVPNSVD